MNLKGLTSALDRLGGKTAVKAIKRGASKETGNMISGAIEGGAILGAGGAVTGGLVAALDGDEDTSIVGGAIKGGLIGGTVGAVSGGAYARITGNRKLIGGITGGRFTSPMIENAQKASNNTAKVTQDVVETAQENLDNAKKVATHGVGEQAINPVALSPEPNSWTMRLSEFQKNYKEPSPKEMIDRELVKLNNKSREQLINDSAKGQLDIYSSQVQEAVRTAPERKAAQVLNKSIKTEQTPGQATMLDWINLSGNIEMPV